MPTPEMLPPRNFGRPNPRSFRITEDRLPTPKHPSLIRASAALIVEVQKLPYFILRQKEACIPIRPKPAAERDFVETEKCTIDAFSNFLSNPDRTTCNPMISLIRVRRPTADIHARDFYLS